MAFTARAVPRADFDAWVTSVKAQNQHLTTGSYAELAKPAVAKEPSFYVLKASDLYDTIVMKYMMPGHEHHAGGQTKGAEVSEDESDMYESHKMEGMNMNHGGEQ